jgi:hypothetical protein
VTRFDYTANELELLRRETGNLNTKLAGVTAASGAILKIIATTPYKGRWGLINLAIMGTVGSYGLLSAVVGLLKPTPKSSLSPTRLQEIAEEEIAELIHSHRLQDWAALSAIVTIKTRLLGSSIRALILLLILAIAQLIGANLGG